MDSFISSFPLYADDYAGEPRIWRGFDKAGNRFQRIFQDGSPLRGWIRLFLC